jgi:hypothetical protein
MDKGMILFHGTDSLQIILVRGSVKPDELRKGAFVDFAFDINDLHKILSEVSHKNTTLVLEGDLRLSQVKLRFEDRITRRKWDAELKTNPNVNFYKAQNLEYVSSCLVDSQEFVEALKKTDTDSFCVLYIEMNNKYITFWDVDEQGKEKVITVLNTVQPAQNPESENYVSGHFSDVYLKLISNAYILSPHVKISLSDESPIHLEYTTEDTSISLSYDLAPMLNEENN